MDYIYAMKAADLTPLKTELIALVSCFLLTEPPFDTAPTAAAPVSSAPPNANTTAGQNATTVAQLRKLVHLISRHDGEFVLKLALHTRHTLHLRSSPNFLVALCAREPTCLPFLHSYMEKMLVLPSDWLAVASFAYFYDSDAEHNYISVRTRPQPQESKEVAEAVGTSSSRSMAPVRLLRPLHVQPASGGCTADARRPNRVSSSSPPPPSSDSQRQPNASLGSSPKMTMTPSAETNSDGTRRYIPSALRTALVRCFARFTPFQLSKYDNTAAEHRAQRRQRRKLLRLSSPPGRSGADGSDADGEESKGASESAGSDTGNEETVVRAPTRKKTFTYKSLVRLLHITEPAWLVCCLLGKRYPADEEEFNRMGLHRSDPSWKVEVRPPAAEVDVAENTIGGQKSIFVKPGARAGRGRGGKYPPKDMSQNKKTVSQAAQKSSAASLRPCRIFQSALCSTRMRLPVVQTWETQLAACGNTGAVWDDLVAARAVPYMAMLRNLRNMLSRTCSSATHDRVLATLVEEGQIAASRQMPFRFYSAFLAVEQVQDALANAVSGPPDPAMPSLVAAGRQRRGNLRRFHTQGRTRAAQPVMPVRKKAAYFEDPSVACRLLPDYLPRYTAALDTALSTAARLNVVPMPGTSLVILCVTEHLFKPLAAMGAASDTGSVQRTVDVAAVLLAMLRRSCEQCVTLLHCYDECVVFHEPWHGGAVAGDIIDGASTGSTSSGNSYSLSTEESLSVDSDEESERSEGGAASRPAASARATSSTRSFMRLVTALTEACATLLARKQVVLAQEGRQRCVEDAFHMFAPDSRAKFPFAFMDEVIERHMRVESLLVMDEGVHRTYAGTNPSAPAFGDLPTYLARMRRTSSPNLVYVGVNLRAAMPLTTLRTAHDPLHSGRVVEVAFDAASVRQRFSHANDVLLTGFSDGILRLVAERVGGGALAVVERAAERYHVSRVAPRVSQDAWRARAKALKALAHLRELTDGAAHRDERREGGAKKSATSATAISSTDVAPAYTSDSSPGLTEVRERPTCASSSLKWPASIPSATTAVSLPSFERVGSAAVSTMRSAPHWRYDIRRSEQQLQGLASSAATLSLPTIGRLLTKRATLEDTSAEGDGYRIPSSTSTHARKSRVAGGAGEETAEGEEEATWLTLNGRNATSVYHPKPFISLVKLLPSPSGASTPSSKTRGVANGTRSPEAQRQRGLLKPSPPLSAGEARSSKASPPPLREAGHDIRKTSHSSQRGSPIRRTQPGSPPRTPTTTTRTIITACSDPQRQKPPAAINTATAATAPSQSSSPTHVLRRLLTSYRLCRFFVSSTFLDMNNERNALTFDVFPRLRRWAAEAGLKVTLLEVDLRWGIPAVATARNLSTSVCLNEVSRCSPFFLGILGARYGSCPPTPLQLVVDEDVAQSDFDWLCELPTPEVSVTELEMRHGVYNTQRRLSGGHAHSPAVFFAREQAPLLASFTPADARRRGVYEPDSATAAQSMAALKVHLCESGCTVASYRATYLTGVSATAGGGGSAPSSHPLTREGISGQAAVSSAGAATGSNGAAGESLNRGQQSPMAGGQTTLDDDLGRWAVRGSRALELNTGGAAAEDDTITAIQSRFSAAAAATVTAAPKRLTSADVPLDMSDFSSTVFAALQGVIRDVCGLTGTGEQVEWGVGELDAERIKDSKICNDATRTQKVNKGEEKPPVFSTAHVVASSTASSDASVDFYTRLVVAQAEMCRRLSKLYAAPQGLLEELTHFTLMGTLEQAKRTSSPMYWPTSVNAVAVGMPETVGTDVLSMRRDQPSERSGNNATTTTTATALHGPRDGGAVLLLEGDDGDGKTSALAALAERVLRPLHASATAALRPDPLPFLFYSTQAADDSARSLLLFLVTAFREVFQLHGEVVVQEMDSAAVLLRTLELIYQALHERYAARSSTGQEKPTPNAGGVVSSSTMGETVSTMSTNSVAIVVLLDGLDKSSEAADLVRLLGTIVHPLATRHVRFLLTACPDSAVARALRHRQNEGVLSLSLPPLRETERAQLVRLHLAAYGKVLEESFTADELKALLRNAGAGRPSCLVSAIAYLRLFSTFDTLREDIRSIPATRTQLYEKFFRQLESRFDLATCRLVLTLLLLRHTVGGMMEYNLYRLVSNVAVASRLVALLRGICVGAHHGRIFLTSNAFVAAIAHTYFPFPSDYQSAQERVLLAELCYAPVDMTADAQEVRHALRGVTDAITRNSVDPSGPRVFVPERYAPRELLGILQGAVQACRFDVVAALVSHLPFLERLLADQRMLVHLTGHLSSVVRMTVEAGDARRSYQAEQSTDGQMSDVQREMASGLTGSAAVPWRHYRSAVLRVSAVLEFMRQHYHVLLRQPAQLRQCVWNDVRRSGCISVYDAATVAHVQQCVSQPRGAVQSFPMKIPSTEVNERKDTGAEEKVAFDGSVPADGTVECPHTTAWVRWVNEYQHASESRVLLSTVSPLPVRCMALHPDGTEVAVGSDDGLVRRVAARDVDGTGGEDGALPLSSNGQKAEQRGDSNDSARPISSLRHESAVTAVLYVPADNSSTSVFGSRRTGGPHSRTTLSALVTTTSTASTAAAAQLLVSGCARGLVYVWNLEDNSLLQRGCGHLRSVSGLTCHPLDPHLLCTSGYDGYVLFWHLGVHSSTTAETGTSLWRLQQSEQRGQVPENCQQQHRPDFRGRQAVMAHALAADSPLDTATGISTFSPFHKEQQHDAPVACIGFHRLGEVCASGGWDGRVLLYRTQALFHSTELPLSSNGKQNGRAARDAYIGRNSPYSIDALSQQPRLESTAFPLSSPVRSLCFTDSLAVTCVAGCQSGAVYVIDGASVAVTARWTSLHAWPTTLVSAAPGGRYVATADARGTVRVVHTGISGAVAATYIGHRGAVTGLGFSASEESGGEGGRGNACVLLTAGEDGTLQGWRVGAEDLLPYSTSAETPALDLRGEAEMRTSGSLEAKHSSTVTVVALSVDGRRIVTGSSDGTAIVFSLGDIAAEEAAARRLFSSHVGTGRAEGVHTDNASRKSRRSQLLGGSTKGTETLGSVPSMSPMFQLQHDHCRITRIQFALQDTRILVGVAFGFVYVWSALPGLNRVEGRLLLRVSVPGSGFYPVVAFGVQECEAPSSTAASLVYRRGADAALVESAESTEEEEEEREGRRSVLGSGDYVLDTFTLGRNGGPSLYAGGETRPNNYAVVTAVCANGDVAVLTLRSDATSLVLAAARDRQRLARQLRRDRRSHSHRTSSTLLDEEAVSRSSSAALSRAATGTFAYPRSPRQAAVEEEGPLPRVRTAKSPLLLPASLGGHGARTSAAPHVLVAPSHGAPEAPPFQSLPFAVHPDEQTAEKTHIGRDTDAAKDDFGAFFAPLPHEDSIVAKAETVAGGTVTPARMRIAVDRRAAKLQRMLRRCRRTEEMLKASFQLHLQRHRLRWDSVDDAAELSAVVWLAGDDIKKQSISSTAETARSPVLLPMSPVDAMTQAGPRRALVVALRQLCLLTTSGAATEVGHCLRIRVPARPLTAAEEGNSSELRPPPFSCNSNGARPTPSDLPISHALEESTRQSASATPELEKREVIGSPISPPVRDEDFEVDVDFLLPEGAYFTAASAALLLKSSCSAMRSTATPSPEGTDTESRRRTPSPPSRSRYHRYFSQTCTRRSGEHTAQTEDRRTSPTSRGKSFAPMQAYAMALATSRGEVWLLRLEVPPQQERKSVVSTTVHGRSVAHGENTDLMTEKSSTALPASPSAPPAKVFLCQRMSFDDGRHAEDGGSDNGSTREHTGAAGRVSSVQVCSRSKLQKAAAPTSDPSDTAGEQVVVLAGGQDGSTRIWTFTAAPAWHSPPFFSTAAAAAPYTAEGLMGTFFCSSAVTAVSAVFGGPCVPHADPMHLSFSPSVDLQQPRQTKNTVAAACRPASWVVGDALGRIYQLCLESEPPGGGGMVRRRLLHSARLRGWSDIGGGDGNDIGGASQSGGHRWQPAGGESRRVIAVGGSGGLGFGSSVSPMTPSGVALFHVVDLMTHPSRAFVGGALSGMQEALNVQSPADFSVPVSDLLLMRHSGKGGRENANEPLTAVTTAPYRTVMKEPNAGGLLRDRPLGNSNELPPEHWSFLPRLPPVLRSTVGFSGLMGMTNPDAINAAAATADDVNGVTLSPCQDPNLFSGTTAASPLAHLPHSSNTALEQRQLQLTSTSCCAALCAKQDVTSPTATLGSLSAPRAIKSVESAFQTPLRALLADYRQPALAEKKQADGRTSHLERGTAVQWITNIIGSPPELLDLSTCDLAPGQSVVALPRTAAVELAPSSKPPGNADTQRRQSSPRQQLMGQVPTTAITEEEDTEDYFSILYHVVPPSTVTGAARRAWLQKRQEVLKEAMRVHRYNKEARAALAVHQQRTALAVTR